MRACRLRCSPKSPSRSIVDKNRFGAGVETFFLWMGFTLLIIVLLFLCLEDFRFRRSPLVTTEGTVFDHSRVTDADGLTYSIQVRFVDEAGRQVEITDTIGRAVPNPPVGTVVKIVYPGGQPEKAVVRRTIFRALLYAIILGMLAVLAARIAGWLPSGGSFGHVTRPIVLC